MLWQWEPMLAVHCLIANLWKFNLFPWLSCHKRVADWLVNGLASRWLCCLCSHYFSSDSDSCSGSDDTDPTRLVWSLLFDLWINLMISVWSVDDCRPVTDRNGRKKGRKERGKTRRWRREWRKEGSHCLGQWLNSVKVGKTRWNAYL